MDRAQIVQDILDKSGGKTYLEIGTWEGCSFFPVRAKRKFAVDVKFKIRSAKRLKRTISATLKLNEERFFKTTSDDFFRKRSYLIKKNKIDVALIDGAHTYQQSLEDILNCLNYLSDKGVIVVHDCNPDSEAAAYSGPSLQSVEKLKLPGFKGCWCGDVWKTIVHLRSSRPDLYVFVLDCDFGVGIVTRGKPEDILNYSIEEIKDMSYRDLELERRKLLNLKPQAFLKEFLEKY